MKLSICNIICKNRSLNPTEKTSLKETIIKDTSDEKSFICRDIDLQYSILYYWILKSTLTTNNHVAITIDGMIKDIGCFYNVDGNKKKHRSSIVKFLKELIKEGLIENYNNEDMDNLKYSEWLRFNFNKNMELAHGYFILEECEIQDIFKYKEKVNHIQLFNTYCFISSCIYRAGKEDKRAKDEQYSYCMVSLKLLSDNNIVRKSDTGLNYMEILKNDIKCIEYKNAGQMYLKGVDNSDRKGVNHFILMKDYSKLTEKEINTMFASILNSYKSSKRAEGYSFKTKAHSKNANNKRKTTMKGEMDDECGK